jgi:hypothetical protein
VPPPALINQYSERPVPSLPRVALPKFDAERERKETAKRFIEQRILRAGVEAWKEIDKISKTGSFEAWLRIGQALAIGRDYALRSTGANAPTGRRYSVAFSEWVRRNGFGAMNKSTRSRALELHTNRDAITAWRQTLTDRQRAHCIHAHTIVVRWRRATTPKKTRPDDALKAAAAAWRHFCACVNRLPADRAEPLWRAVQSEAAAALGT